MKRNANDKQRDIIQWHVLPCFVKCFTTMYRGFLSMLLLRDFVIATNKDSNADDFNLDKVIQIQMSMPLPRILVNAATKETC